MSDDDFDLLNDNDDLHDHHIDNDDEFDVEHSNQTAKSKSTKRNATTKLEKQSTYPITLKPATGHTLLVELHDPGLSLINDTGVIGRFIPQVQSSSQSSSHESGNPHASDRVEFDLKGHIYSGELRACPTVWIIVQSNNECKVESACHTVASVYRQHETLREEITGDIGDMDDDEYSRPIQVNDSDDDFTDGKKKKKTTKSSKSSSKKSTSSKSASSAAKPKRKSSTSTKSKSSKSSSTKKRKK